MAENNREKERPEDELQAELKTAEEIMLLPGASYLIAADDQHLGIISSNKYHAASILNQYGTFGSKYSTTSIFNQYSQYGSKYGTYSLNNPYCSQPPRLYLNGIFAGVVSENKFISDRISTEFFLYALENDIESLLNGKIPKIEIEIRQDQGESYIIAHDGIFLGSLTPNQFDAKSIFNEFGAFGSSISKTSIFNQFCPYGGGFSALSPFNQHSQTPPKVYLKAKLAGILTVNQFLLGTKINPNTIKEWAKQRL